MYVIKMKDGFEEAYSTSILKDKLSSHLVLNNSEKFERKSVIIKISIQSKKEKKNPYWSWAQGSWDE